MSQRRVKDLSPVWCLLFLMTGLLVLPGCGGAGTVKKVTGKVTGTVTFDGQPVKAGSISLEAKAGGAGAAAPIEAGGKFTVSDPVPVGKYLVSVQPVEVSPDDVFDGKAPPPPDDIPEKYRSGQTSELTFKVKEGENTLSIEMKKQ